MGGLGGFGKTYLTTCGAMTLQGPHHVAKQSRTISPDPVMASSKSFFDCRLCTPSLPIVALKSLVVVMLKGV